MLTLVIGRRLPVHMAYYLRRQRRALNDIDMNIMHIKFYKRCTIESALKIATVTVHYSMSVHRHVLTYTSQSGYDLVYDKVYGPRQIRYYD